ncbi:hypothetical protein GRX01_02620 [Halobaculum sp. WSA2]|uniref:Uncharacterized protein n=1 Tax=Halobaculum saliterrae TaxID=2073113 RepID=A0A6B0SUG6_9EURY|nr:hypothetical protein [Halobaculum saliterrae]MXR40253.1 hypothetical protein [Halobaculum saliterrae]
MTRQLLVDAAEHAERAAEAVDDGTAERLAGVADDLRAVADESRSGPDHGWMAKRINTLREATSNADEGVREHADAAIESISEYREGVPGV